MGIPIYQGPSSIVACNYHVAIVFFNAQLKNEYVCIYVYLYIQILACQGFLQATQSPKSKPPQKGNLINQSPGDSSRDLFIPYEKALFGGHF